MNQLKILHQLILNALSVLLLMLSGCNSSNTDSSQFYLPAEWETQRAMMISFDNDAAGDSVSLEMVKYVSAEMKVYCFIVDSLEVKYKSSFKNAGINLDSIQFVQRTTSFPYVCRDGLLFLKNRNGENKLVYFLWNSYGWYNDSILGNKLMQKDTTERKLFEYSIENLFDYPVINSTMVNEGGAIETNGAGIIIQVESVNMHRNPNLNKSEQENELKRVLKVKKIIWLKEGVADDPHGWATRITQNYFGIGVRGHVDEFCRFADEHNILLAFPDSLEAANDPVKKLTWDRMKLNYEILKNETDQDGKSFNIIKVPLPDINYLTFTLDSTSHNEEIQFLSRRILKVEKEFNAGDNVHYTPAGSYLNFLITNHSVLIPKYFEEGMPESCKVKDETVKQIFEKYFPNKKIIQINPIGLNYLGGGLHCWSQQVPK